MILAPLEAAFARNYNLAAAALDMLCGGDLLGLALFILDLVLMNMEHANKMRLQRISFLQNIPKFADLVRQTEDAFIPRNLMALYNQASKAASELGSFPPGGTGVGTTAPGPLTLSGAASVVPSPSPAAPLAPQPISQTEAAQQIQSKLGNKYKDKDKRFKSRKKNNKFFNNNNSAQQPKNAVSAALLPSPFGGGK